MRSKRNLLLFTVAPLCAAAASAQTGNGILTGTVTDPQGAALHGVRVALLPGNGSALTDATGKYTLLGIAAGSYTLDIAYTGFTPQSLPVNIVAGSTVTVDATLAIAETRQHVDVYAPREGGELEAISRTFNADNIINVLPADVITSLPNANVADAIGRLPDVTLERDEGEGKYVKVRGTEPRLTHTLLDGVTIATPEPVRQVKLDLIPADLVQSVQINKTLQANMEGDGIGGTVDLLTKTAEDRPTIYLDSTGGYTPILTGRAAYQFDGTLGKRFGNRKFGALVSASYDWNGRGINDVEPGPALAGTYDQRDYRYYRSRWGFGGTLDYRLTDTSSVYLKYLYSRFYDYGEDWIYTPTINTWADSTTLTQGAPTGGSLNFEALSRRPVQDIGGLQLGGHHVLRNALFNWELNSSLGRTKDNGYTFENFAPAGATDPLTYDPKSKQGIPFVLNLSNPLEPHITPTNGVNIYDPTQYFLYGKQVANTYLPEVDLGFGASLAIPYRLAGHTSTFEFGGLFRNEHKFENLDTLSYAPSATLNANDPSLAMSNFLTSTFSDPNYYGNAYHEGPVVNPDQVAAYSGFAPSGSNIGNSFNYLEKVSAGYLMNSTDIGRWRFNLGLRIEATNANSLGYLGSRNANSLGTAPERVTNDYITLLPSASARYALTPTQGLRLVYSRGLARPDFQNLVAFASAPSGGTARNSSSQGNPHLQAEFADDLDLLYENNLQRAGLLQAGFYYKNISNPIVATQTLQPPNPTFTGNDQPFYLNQSINAGSAWVYGFELAYIQHFNQLPGLFSGLGVSANYGYTASQLHFPPFVDLTQPNVPVGTVSGPNRGPEGANPALLGQAPNTFNFSPTYDKRNLSVRLGMTFNQANLYSYIYTTDNNGPITQGGAGGGPTGPNGDVYFYNHLQLDLQGSYRLPKGLTAVVYGLNLNNEVFGFYQGGADFPIQREFYRQTVGGGLRWSPHTER